MKNFICFLAIAFGTVYCANASPLCVPTHFVTGLSGADCTPLIVEGTQVTPLTQYLVATGGDITVTQAGWATSAEIELLFNGVPIFDNMTTPLGTQEDLGTFAAGTILPFSIFVVPTENTFYAAPPSTNGDKVVHFACAAWTANSAIPNNGLLCGTEDSFDYGAGTAGFPNNDFNDEDFEVTDIGIGPTPVVPEPSSALLTGVALFALFSIRQRRLVRRG